MYKFICHFAPFGFDINTQTFTYLNIFLVDLVVGQCYYTLKKN